MEDLETDYESKNLKKYKLMFFLLGNSSLLCFNVGINAIDIFNKICSRNDMGTILSKAYNFPASLFALSLCFFKPKNLKFTISLSLLAMTLLLISIQICTLMKQTEKYLFGISISIFGLFGIISALAFSSIFSLASQFDSVMGVYVSSGNGCCGVLASVLRIFTKALFSSENQLKTSSTTYFILAATITISTFVFFIVMSKDEIISKKLKDIKKKDSDEKVCSSKILTTIKTIWLEWISVFINFFITLSLFPGYVTRIKQPKALGDWTPIIVVTLFCIFDWIGRYLPSLFFYPKRTRAWIPHAIRFIYYPIFIIGIQDIVTVGEPWWTFFWTCTFALTNGYSSTVSFIYGINHEKLTLEDRSHSSFLMSFSINAGILFAMIISFGIDKLPTK